MFFGLPFIFSTTIIITTMNYSIDNLLWRLENIPDSVPDEDLRILQKHHEHSRGRLARIPAMCGLILDKRHPPHSQGSLVSVKSYKPTKANP